MTNFSIVFKRSRDYIARIRGVQSFNGVMQTAGALSVARATTAAVQLALVPMLLKYLGVETYGVWVAICALTAILQIADLGLSNAMVNEVSKFANMESNSELLKFLATRYRMLVCISIMIGCGGLVISSFDGWRGWLNIQNHISDESLRNSLFAIAFMAAIQVTVNANQQVWLGLQKGVFIGIFLAIGALLNLGAVALCVKFGAGLHWIVLASSFGSIVAQGIGTILIFSKLHLRLVDVLKISFKANEIVEILKSGRGFFLIQLCGLLSNNLDVLFVSRFIGGNGVAEYSVVMRLFSIPTLVMSLFLSGLWPVIARAQANKDYFWIQRSFYRTLALSLALSSVAAICLCLGSNYLISSWTGDVIRPSKALVLGFSLWVILTAVGGNLSTYMNGIGDISYQAKMAVVFAVLNVTVSLVLVNLIGVSGPIWGSVVVTSIYYGFALHRVRKIMHSQVEVIFAMRGVER